MSLPRDLAIVLLASLVAGEMGLAVPFTSANVSALWPAAGVAVASLLVFGYRVWPAIMAGAFLVNFFTPVPVLAAAGIAIGNTVGPLCGTALLRRLGEFDERPIVFRDVIGRIMLGALCAAAISATIGVGVLFTADVTAWFGVGSAWLVWCFGDAMGVLMVAPAVLTFAALLARQKNARRALEESEHTYRVIADRSLKLIDLLTRAVEQTADSVMIADRHGTIEYVNPSFEATTGYSGAEAIGKTPRILRSGFHDEEFYARLWTRILGGQPFRGTLVNRKKSGELYCAEQTITPIKDAANQITHFVSVLKDMTEARKRQEQELQLRLARGVQQRFYAAATMSAAGFEIASAIHPAVETGGDYLDLFELPAGRLCIGIGDVSGHGLDSAIVMALTRAYVRSFAQSGDDAAQVLTNVNGMLCRDLEENRFVTLLLVCLDASKGCLSYAGAGHVPGYLLGASGETERVLESSGPPLGLFPNSRYRTAAIPLLPQQLLVLMTDGITEIAGEDDDGFGTDGVLEYVRAHASEPARDIADGVYRAARAAAAGSPQADDVTEVIVRVCQSVTGA